MLKIQKISIFTAFKWLSEKYIELEKKTIPYSCKLGAAINKNNKQFIEIIFSGQSHAIIINAEKVIEQNLFEYFSPEDKKRIFSMVYKKEKLKLSDQYLCHETGKELIVLTDLLTNNRMTISVELSSVSMDLIDKLNSRDANKIGFLSGLEYIKKSLSHLPIEQ